MYIMKKKFTSLILIISMVIALSFPILALANTSPTTTRLAGADRYATASSIAKQGWTQSDYVVLAFGENYPDALSAAPLAKKYNAPILLTTSSNLPDVTKQTLTDLQVKNVFIIGGTGVISTSVESELQSIGITPTRLAGQDRYETAIKVAQQISSPSTLFVAIGEDYPDALSVAPIAASKQIPIILVPKDYMPDSIKNYVSSVNVGKTYVIGYSDIIDDSVVNQFPNPERITGADKYARNIAINQKFDSEFNSSSVCLATGEGFADALTGAVYASKINEPIILVNNSSPSNTKSYYKQRSINANNVYVFGGTGVVSDNVVQDLNSDNTPTPTSTASSISNPASLNTAQTVIVNNIFENYTAQATVKQIIRGRQAWDMIISANQFNDPPKDGYEYILAKINFKLLDIGDGKALNLNGSVNFKLVSQDGKTYNDFYSVVEPEPKLDSSLYKGASSEGWAAFLVKTTDIKPLLSYGTNYDGSGGIWFKAYNDETTVNTPSNSISNPIPTQNDIATTDFMDYIKANYSTLDTPMGKLHFTFTKITNDYVGIPYDIHIQTDWDAFEFSPFDLAYSRKISDTDKQKTITALKGFQQNIAQVAFKYYPEKRIKGGFYSGFYEYPSLKVGYESIQFLTWTNYDDSFSDNPSITSFHWYDIIDDYKF